MISLSNNALYDSQELDDYALPLFAKDASSIFV